MDVAEDHSFSTSTATAAALSDGLKKIQAMIAACKNISCRCGVLGVASRLILLFDGMVVQ